jgi:hypothetical protein
MLFIISYSCFTAAFFSAFAEPRQKDMFNYVEHFVLCSFSLEIVFNFMRLTDGDEDEKNRSHAAIARRYLKSGWFFFDILATFPFYLIETVGNQGIWFKLMRMIRIP